MRIRSVVLPCVLPGRCQVETQLFRLFQITIHFFFFFFSSRRRHTRSLRDWSSDVCSSDLWMPVLPLTLSRNAGVGVLPYDLPDLFKNVLLGLTIFSGPTLAAVVVTGVTERSEEHTSELQSRRELVCRLLLEKKKEDASASQ